MRAALGLALCLALEPGRASAQQVVVTEVGRTPHGACAPWAALAILALVLGRRAQRAGS